MERRENLKVEDIERTPKHLKKNKKTFGKILRDRDKIRKC